MGAPPGARLALIAAVRRRLSGFRGRLARCGLGLLLVAGLGEPVASPAAEPRELLALVASMESAYAGVIDYTARFGRREVVAGQRRPHEEADLKFQRPGRIYLRWTSGPAAGREILFVGGRDGDRLLLHEPGFISGRFTIVMAPDHRRVLAESRHPITDVGFGRLIDLIAREVRRGLAAGEVQLTELGTDPVGRRIELSFPADPARGYYCRRFAGTLRAGLPVRATVHDFGDHVVAEYSYDDVRLNPGLTAGDFDPANPKYAFPRVRLPL